MAYKRQSPTPISEGGTNAQAFANTNGTIVYDGTSLVSVNPGMAGEVLTSFGLIQLPTFEPSSGSGTFWVGSSGGPQSNLCIVTGVGGPQAATINYLSAAPISDNTLPRFPLPFACTFSNLYVIVYSNSVSNAITMAITINGVVSALAVTVPAGTTGTFSDTVNSAMAAQGQLLTLQSNEPTGSISQNVIGQFTVRVTPF